MADQRSGFRFRVPRLRSSVPPPRPTASIPTQTTPRRPPIRPQPTPAPIPPTQPQSTAPPPQGPTRPPTLQVAPAPTPTPALSPMVLPSPPPPPPPPPKMLPNRSLGTVPDSLRTRPTEPSTTPQHEATTRAPTPPQVAVSQPTIQSRVSSQPPSSSTTSAPISPSVKTSQPSSPPTSPSHLTSQATKKPTSPMITKAKVQQDTDINTHDVMNMEGDTKTDAETNEEKHEETSTDLSSDHQSDSETNIRHQPQILHEQQDFISTTSNVHSESHPKSTTLHPEDNVLIPKSPEKSVPNEPQTPYREETTGSSSEFVITFNGSNRGTSMRLGSGATKRVKSVHILRKYKANPDESDEETTTDGEESSNEKQTKDDLEDNENLKKNAYIINCNIQGINNSMVVNPDESDEETTTDGEESSNKKKTKDDLEDNENLEKNAYIINCNIQGINNSMVVNYSFTERNPGVYLGSSSIPENVMKLKRRFRKSMSRYKVKVNINPSQKHTIRRRCLRGLFMDSSDSDSNDPQKPRRHGCRYMNGEISNKDDKMDAS